MATTDKERNDDQFVRAFLAFLFPGALMLFIIILLALLVFDKITFNYFRSGIAIFSSLLTGYIGTIIGYYFGKQNIVEQRKNKLSQDQFEPNDLNISCDTLNEISRHSK